MEQRFQTHEERREQKTATSATQDNLPATHQKPATQDKPTALVGNQLDPEVVDGLMRRLDQEEGSRSDPRWMLPHEREALLEQLTRQARSQTRRLRWGRVMYSILGMLFIGLNLASISGQITYSPFIMLVEMCAVIASLGVYRTQRQWGRAAERMALFDDPRVTGPLLEALDLRNPDVVAAAEKALTRLLPRLQASDADSITAVQRERLYRRLKIENAQNAAEFQIAALRALEQIGDAKALPCVETLAASTATTANATRVREAARHCLAFLRARAEQQRYSDSLLRASSSLEIPSDALLRPADPTPATDPQHLLRPDNPEN